jgi:hypothetical protein
MSTVEQLLSLYELGGRVSMSRREWEQRFPGQWQHLQLILDSGDELSEVVPRSDDPTEMLDVISLPDDAIVACDPCTRQIDEHLSHTECGIWQLNTEKLIRLVLSLVGGTEVRGAIASPRWNFGRWPSKGAHKLPLYFASPSHRSELSSMLRESAAPGGKKAAAIFTLTDRFWSPDVPQTARSVGIVVVPIMEVLELDVTGWYLSQTWPRFESAFHECLNVGRIRNGRPNRKIGRMHERRVAIEQIEGALLTIAYERITRFAQASLEDRDSMRSEQLYWKDVAEFANLTPSRVSNAVGSRAGERAKQLFGLVNDADKLFSKDPQVLALLSCDSLVELKSKSKRTRAATPSGTSF